MTTETDTNGCAVCNYILPRHYRLLHAVTVARKDSYPTLASLFRAVVITDVGFWSGASGM